MFIKYKFYISTIYNITLIYYFKDIMEMSWRVVHFMKENTVEAVSATWVKNNYACFWPSYSGLKLRNIIQNCIPPAHDWDLHQCRLIGEF